jgi:hypothetical protein
MSGGAIIGAVVGLILAWLMAVIRSTKIPVSVKRVAGCRPHTQHIRGGLKNEPKQRPHHASGVGLLS